MEVVSLDALKIDVHIGKTCVCDIFKFSFNCVFTVTVQCTKHLALHILIQVVLLTVFTNQTYRSHTNNLIVLRI